MNKKLLLILTLLIPLSGFSQMATRWLSDYTGGGTYYDLGKIVAQDSYGNVYMAGQIDNGTDLDILLIKYNSEGTEQWVQSFDNGADDEVVNLHIDNADNIYVTGNTNISGKNQMLILKYYPSGSLGWDINTTGVAGVNVTASDIYRTNIIVTGYYASSSSDLNTITMKYDSTGTQTWVKTYDQSTSVSNDEEVAMDVCVHQLSGDIYVVGRADVSGAQDMLVLRYSSAGTQQWARTRDYSTTYDEAMAVSVGGLFSNLGIYITTLSKTSSVGYGQMITYKYNSSGVYQWDETYGSGLAKVFNYFEGGNIYSYGVDIAGSSTEVGAFLVQYSNTGTEQWNLQTTGSYYNTNSTFPMVNVNGYLYTPDRGEVKKINESTGVVDDSLQVASTNIHCLIPGANGVICCGSHNVGAYFYTFELCTPVSSLSAGNDTVLCQYDTISLNGSGADAYQWVAITPGLSMQNVTTANPTVTTTSSENLYYVKLSGADINGCPLENDTVEIEVRGGIDISSDEIFYDTPTEFCSGGFVDLNVIDRSDSLIETYWYKDGVYAGVYDTSFTATLEGDYYVEFRRPTTSCVRYSEVETVTYVTSQSDVDLGNDTSICANMPFEIASDITGLYAWNTGDTTKNIYVSTPGSYIVTVTVPGCAGATDTLNIVSVYQNPVVDLGSDTSFCSNLPYHLVADDNHSSYFWSTGSTEMSVAATQSGTYWCEVTNPSGCTYSDTVSITYTHFGYAGVSPDTTICSGTSVILSPDYFYHRTDYFDFNEDQTSHSYSVSGPSVTHPTIVSTQCNGNNSTSVCSHTGTTGYFELTVSVDAGVDQIILAPVFNEVYSGTVDVEIDGINFGSVSAFATCEEDSMLFTGLSGVSGDGELVLHFADNVAGTGLDGHFKISEISVYSPTTPASGYSWASTSGFSSTNYTESITPTESDDYVFTYVEGSCMLSDTANITVGMVQLGADIHACVGDTVTIDAGTGFTGYAWSTGESSSSIEVVSEDDYLITATNASCGTTYDTIHVYFHQPAVPALGSDTDMCAGDTLLLDAGSANDWFWSTGGTGQTLTVTTDGTYSITVSDDYGCQNSDTITVDYHSNPSVNLGADYSACDTTVLNAGAFASYGWSNGSTSDTALIISSGSYSVTVYNAYGCSASDTINITIATTPDADINNNYGSFSKYGTIEICDHETLYFPNTNPGCSHLWSTGSTNDTIHVTSSGIYSVTVTDPTGLCSDSDTVEVVVHPSPDGTVTTYDASCGLSDGNAAVDLTVGTGPFSYEWSTGATATDSISGLPAGSYWVRVQDSNYCRDTLYFSVQNPNAPSVAFNTDSVSCFNYCDGYASTNLTGGTSPFSFVWSNGDTTSYADTLCAGIYYLTVTDAANCITYDTAVIEEPLELSSSMYSIDESAFGAGDGSAWVIPSGGTAPYFYSWSGSFTTDSISGLTSGWYYVTVTDDNGCTVIDSVEISFTTMVEDFENLIQVYPNPVGDGHVFVNNPAGYQMKCIVIFDADGRQIIARFEDECIYLDQLASGVYFLQIKWSNDLITQHKLIIQN